MFATVVIAAVCYAPAMANRFVRRIRDRGYRYTRSSQDRVQGTGQVARTPTWPDPGRSWNSSGCGRTTNRPCAISSAIDSGSACSGRRKPAGQGAPSPPGPAPQARLSEAAQAREGNLRYEYARWCCIRALARVGERWPRQPSSRFERSDAGTEGQPTDGRRRRGRRVRLSRRARRICRRSAAGASDGAARRPRQAADRSPMPADALRFLSELSACLGIGSALPA